MMRAGPRISRAALAAAALWLCAAGATAGPAQLTLVPAPLLTAAPRFGLNLGSAHYWGAEQFASNILRNPGFEPLLDRSVVVVARSDGRTFADNDIWQRRPDGFWRGGTFDVRTGAARGRSGRIDGSSAAADRLPRFVVDAELTLAPGDVIVVSRVTNEPAAHLWWPVGAVEPAPALPRPGSAGTQSLRLTPSPGAPASVQSFLDSLGARAGKLLPINGRWRFSLWARSEQGSPRLQMRFGRKGSAPFMSQEFAPTATWHEYAFEFDARDEGPALPLEVTIAAIGNGALLVDDADLHALADVGAFRHEVVATLKALHPGYLRDWQGQLGDSTANRLAAPDARMPNRYRAGGTAEAFFHYGLPDFLDLAHAIDAQPWVVVPTVLTDAELSALGRFLAQRAASHGFREVLVEFGNENWNITFRAAGYPDAAAHAAAAERAFRQIRDGAGAAAPLRFVVNAQYVDPRAAARLAGLVPSAQRIAIAPYVLPRLDAMTDADAVTAAFGDSIEPLRRLRDALPAHVGVAVYEVNFHTLGGGAPAAVRNAAAAGAASGAVLARRLLQALRLGVREQAVYTLAGFDAKTTTGATVPLWGVARDLATAGRLRPTGLALLLLNRAVRGDAHDMTCAGSVDCEALTAVAFVASDATRIALVSTSSVAVDVALRLPDGGRPAAEWRAWTLSGARVADDNESAERVRITPLPLDLAERDLHLTVPPHSLVALLPIGETP
jgi:hypothetical protein